jgi:hypothetical protein
VAAHNVGNELHSQIVVVDSGATRHMFYDLSVFHKLESIAPTTLKLGDDSTANCTQIGVVVLHMSDGRRPRLSQALCAPPRHKPPERVPACKEGHYDVVHQDRMCLD